MGPWGNFKQKLEIAPLIFRNLMFIIKFGNLFPKPFLQIKENNRKKYWGAPKEIK